MEWLISGLMLLVLLVLSGLILVGGRALRSSAGAAPAGEAIRWPPVALIVPVAGASPGLEANLRSLLTQDYPDYQAVLVTRDSEDPATGVIESLILDYPQAALVLSGPARTCGQKNHNLLAGLGVISGSAEILAFCDSNQLAPATFLKELVGPLVRGEAEVISGYHHIIPQDEGFGTLGHAISVLTLYLTKPFKKLNQPWGGATAIKRALFEALNVDRLWAENVVDDVSLAAHLLKSRIPVGLAPGACLHTALGGETLAGWSNWLTRQWLYLKFCLPGTWLAGGLVTHLLLGLVVAAVGYGVLALVRWNFPAQALIALMFLGLLGVLGDSLRSLHPRPAPLKSWLTAFYVAIFMASWCHLRTWWAREIEWRGITY